MVEWSPNAEMVASMQRRNVQYLGERQIVDASIEVVKDREKKRLSNTKTRLLESSFLGSVGVAQ